MVRRYVTTVCLGPVQTAHKVPEVSSETKNEKQNWRAIEPHWSDIRKFRPGANGAQSTWSIVWNQKRKPELKSYWASLVRYQKLRGSNGPDTSGLFFPFFFFNAKPLFYLKYLSDLWDNPAKRKIAWARFSEKSHRAHWPVAVFGLCWVALGCSCCVRDWTALFVPFFVLFQMMFHIIFESFVPALHFYQKAKSSSWFSYNISDNTADHFFAVCTGPHRSKFCRKCPLFLFLSSKQILSKMVEKMEVEAVDVVCRVEFPDFSFFSFIWKWSNSARFPTFAPAGEKSTTADPSLGRWPATINCFFSDRTAYLVPSRALRRAGLPSCASQQKSDGHQLPCGGPLMEQP